MLNGLASALEISAGIIRESQTHEEAGNKIRTRIATIYKQLQTQPDNQYLRNFRTGFEVADIALNWDMPMEICLTYAQQSPTCEIIQLVEEAD